MHRSQLSAVLSLSILLSALTTTHAASAGAKKVKPVAPVPQTGQMECWNASGTLIPCDGTGQDGDFLAGVEWPTPRFTDNLNGTVTDNLTGLIWLKNANCFPGSGVGIPWQAALDAANALASGSCELSDGSVAGDWRLPNGNELRSLIDWGNFSPALPAGHPFSGVPSGPNIAQWAYLTSTSIVDSPDFVWYVHLANGNALSLNKGVDAALVWPVRGGN
jgi:hypothetical protein